MKTELKYLFAPPWTELVNNKATQLILSTDFSLGKGLCNNYWLQRGQCEYGSPHRSTGQDQWEEAVLQDYHWIQIENFNKTDQKLKKYG